MAKDKHEIDELLLYIANEFPLYKKQKAIEVNLTKHACRGEFDIQKAAKGFSYLTADAAKSYAKEFGHRIAPDSRREVDKALAQDYVGRVKEYRSKGVKDLPSEAMELLDKSSCTPTGLAGRRRR